MSLPTLDGILEGRRSQPHLLIEVLQDLQENFGYISEEAMTRVSRELGVPLIEVYRVASFYKAFSLTPRGKNLITVCQGTACHVRQAKLLLNQACTQLKVESGGVTEDGLFSVEHVNCLGACALGPVVVFNGAYHHHMNPGKLRGLIERAGNGGKEDSSNA
jgi:NADH:ubiquinone oxidoreductase subunit E